MGRPNTDAGGADVLVGSVVAERYHVAGILGQGSNGTVFGVENIHLARRMAMKVLRPLHTPSDVVHRVFNGDARSAWSVSHPCLVDVFDVGTLPDGAPFFVSEYLEGETLAKRLARDRLSLAAAVDVMMQLLAAIAAVHDRALLVRDLRPQNVFLTHRRGCRPIAKILDLGLARLVSLDVIADEWEADPQAAMRLPQPFYLSPERTRSEHGVEPASDLFVAGIIFYEMLTGTRPFASPTYNGLLLKIAQASPPAVSELRDHSLAELDAFVARSLSGNPRSRHGSAKEMQDELRRIFETSKRVSVTPSMAILASNTGIPPSGTGPSARPAPLAQPPVPRGFDPEVPPQAGRLREAHIDEASADNPHRTIPPPSSLANAVTPQAFTPASAISQTRPSSEPDEETQQRKMTPELHAKIEAHYEAQRDATPRPPMRSEMDSIPPPTKRMDK